MMHCFNIQHINNLCPGNCILKLHFSAENAKRSVLLLFSPALNSARWNSDVPTLPPGFLSNLTWAFTATVAAQKCKFLHRHSVDSSIGAQQPAVFIYLWEQLEATQHSCWNWSYGNCVGSGDTQAAALFLFCHCFCHTSAESTVTHQKLSVCWRAKPLSTVLTSEPSFLLLTCDLHDLSMLLCSYWLQIILTDCRSSASASFLVQRHAIILHFWHCFGVNLHVSMLS